MTLLAEPSIVDVVDDRESFDQRDRTPARRPGRVVLRAVIDGVWMGLLGGVLVLALLAVAVPAAVGGTPLTILTGSMSPGLPPGTLVVVRPTPLHDIRIGDVITYQLESGQPTLVTHRVVARVTDSATDEVRFVTQGDANDVRDPATVRPVQIRGTVWYAIPWLGHVNQVVDRDARRPLVTVAAAGLFAYAAWMFTSGVRDRRR